AFEDVADQVGDPEAPVEEIAHLGEVALEYGSPTWVGLQLLRLVRLLSLLRLRIAVADVSYDLVEHAVDAEQRRIDGIVAEDGFDDVVGESGGVLGSHV